MLQIDKKTETPGGAQENNESPFPKENQIGYGDYPVVYNCGKYTQTPRISALSRFAVRSPPY
ncbi:hypothetical protein D3C73_1629270 [compost metagenome]